MGESEGEEIFQMLKSKLLTTMALISIGVYMSNLLIIKETQANIPF